MLSPNTTFERNASIAAILDGQYDNIRYNLAGLRESHPHDVTITREAPNYSL